MQRSVLLSAKAIIPARQGPEVLQDWIAENKKISKEATSDFKKTVRTWKHKVTFVTKESFASGRISFRIYTEDDVWRWLDEGTKDHFIPVVPPSQMTKAGTKGKGFLAWQSGYKPKTKVGIVPSVAGGPFGDWAFDKKGHMVSGIEPRNWIDLIYEKWNKLYTLRMQNRLNEALKKVQPTSNMPRYL